MTSTKYAHRLPTPWSNSSPPSNQLSQLDLDHDRNPDVDTSREEVKTGAKAVVVKQTSPSALSRVPPELFYHIASCLTEGFQPKDIRLVYPDLRHGARVCRSWRAAFQRRLCLVVQLPRRAAAEGFLESGLTDRYPVELLTILPTGHARYREVDSEGVLGCATCLKLIRAVAGHLKILSNIPCYRPWDQKIAHLLRGLEEVHLDPTTSGEVGRVVQGQVTWAHLKTFAPVMLDSDKIRTFVDHIVTPALEELMLPDLAHQVLGPDALDRSWQRLLDASGPRLKLVEVWHRTSRAEDYYDASAAIRKYAREIFVHRQLNVELAFVRDIGLTRRLLTMTLKSGTTPLRSISLLVSIANPLSAIEFTREVTDGIKSTDFPDLRELEIVVTASLSNYKAGPMSRFSGLVVRRPPPEEAVSMASLQNYIQGSKLWDELRRYCKTRRISLVIQGQVRE